MSLSPMDPLSCQLGLGRQHRSLLLYHSYLVRVTDDLCAAKPHDHFQVPSAPFDMAHPSLILETLFFPFHLDFWRPLSSFSPTPLTTLQCLLLGPPLAPTSLCQGTPGLSPPTHPPWVILSIPMAYQSPLYTANSQIVISSHDLSADLQALRANSQFKVSQICNRNLKM